MKNIFLFFLTLLPTLLLAQSPDGTFKTLTATMPSTDAYAISEPLPSTYDPREKFIVAFPVANTTTTPTLNRNGLGAKLIKNEDGTSPAVGTICCRKLLSYNGTYFQIISSPQTFSSDVTFTLAAGKSFGKYTNGQTAPWTGLTVAQAIQDAAVEYINPVFTSFSVSGQATTIEVGTTLSGSKTFTWAITQNSGVVNTIDLFDNTASATLLAATPNDGTQAQTITTIQLNSNGATQSWKGIGNNSSPSGTFNSSNFVVTARFIRFFGPTASSPTNSATVRALPSSAFHTGATTFTLNTGNSLTKFVVALPPGVTISQVIDIDALNANITSQYVLTGTINVLDAGGTNRAYNIYEMNVGSPYSTSHQHSITTAN